MWCFQVAWDKWLTSVALVSEQEEELERGGVNPWGLQNSKGRKEATVPNKGVAEERKKSKNQTKPESLISRSMSPQHLSLHVKFCTLSRISSSPYSSMIHKSFPSEIPICEVITWFQSYSDSNGSLPSELSIYNSTLTSISFLEG